MLPDGFALQDLFAVLVAFLIVTAAPGPANLAVATVSMRSGRADGMRFAAGLALGLAIWGMVAATGLGAVLERSAQGLVVLKFLGGGYLLWLALQSARSAVADDPKRGEVLDVSRRAEIWQGLILNLSNPKAVLAWMAALSMGLGSTSASLLIVLATGGCALLGLANYAAYVLVFSQPRAMRIYERIGRWIDGSVAVLFGVAGLGLIRSALAR